MAAVATYSAHLVLLVTCEDLILKPMTTWAARRALLLRAVFTQLAVATFEADGIHKALLEVRHSPLSQRRRNPHARALPRAQARLSHAHKPATSTRNLITTVWLCVVRRREMR
jgi:hypothetical protein